LVTNPTDEMKAILERDPSKVTPAEKHEVFTKAIPSLNVK